MGYLPDFSQSIVTKLRALDPLTQTLASVLLLLLILSYHKSGAWKLRNFPTVGPSLPLFSFIGTIKFCLNTHDVVETGRRKWPNRMFKISAVTGWQVVVTDPTHVAEMRVAPESKLSHTKAVEELLQSRFTLNHPYVMENQIHIPIIKTRLRKETGLVRDIYEEVVEACNQHLPVKDEWTGVFGRENLTTIIALVANRVFVGPVLCRNPDWIKLCINYTVEVAKTAILINLFPSFLHPLVNYVAGGKLAQSNRDGLEILKPFIAARRNENKEENFNDFLSWLIEKSGNEESDDFPIAARIFAMNFAAIHTTSLALTHVLLDLASNPEYVQPLREEVEEVTNREGWTKAALDQMCKVDSFLKESQRFNPAGLLLMSRYATSDYIFSDGTFIPAGTMLAVSCNSLHLDPQTFEDPLRFDGFRFIKMKERAELDGFPDKRFDFASTSADFVAFGQGRHACPGRVFASTELKTLIAYIVTTYDLKLADGVRPPNLFMLNANVPNPAAKIYFRRRQ